MHWLHCAPADDLDEWLEQVRRAVWLERRYFTGMANSFWGKHKD